MSAKNWHRTALEMGRERDNDIAQELIETGEVE